MDIGVRLEVLWNDADIFEVRMAAWNGLFGGSANIYVGIGGLAEAAEKLKGFHVPPRQVHVRLGAFGPHFAGGAATIDFYCTDSAGHASVQVRIESDHRRKSPAQSVLLMAAVEPAAVDSFVSDLRRLEADQRGTAFFKTFG